MADDPGRLTDDEIDMLRGLHEYGQELTIAERRRRGLGYTGLAKKFGIPKRTVRSYISYERRAYYQGRCADMDEEK